MATASRFVEGHLLGKGSFGTATVERWHGGSSTLVVRKVPHPEGAPGPPVGPEPPKAALVAALGPILGVRALKGPRGAQMQLRGVAAGAGGPGMAARRVQEPKGALALREEAAVYLAVGHHPSVLRFLEAGGPDDPPFLLLELAAGMVPYFIMSLV
jgi:hypothetical protein